MILIGVSRVQVHRISKNTIQVNMDTAELKERGITMLDLLGNKSQIQNFFYQILKEVDTDHTFAKDDPVTFQVMPSSSGLELLITKVTDKNDEEDNPTNQELKQLLEGLTGVSSDASSSRQTEISEDSDDLNHRIYEIEGIDATVGLAESLQVEGLASSLYTFRHHYFLDLAFLDDNYIEMKPTDAWAIANEFGTSIPLKKFEKIKSQAKRLITQDALGNLRRYFVKA